MQTFNEMANPTYTMEHGCRDRRSTGTDSEHLLLGGGGGLGRVRNVRQEVRLHGQEPVLASNQRVDQVDFVAVPAAQGTHACDRKHTNTVRALRTLSVLSRISHAPLLIAMGCQQKHEGRHLTHVKEKRRGRSVFET